ncbi:hypothetical protein MNBD_GAMMA09-904 [hydrothermal vent metagenome]|uniref:Uncharacterized protein n=1 Tax=hydrothermal vent metagenome TaxID=652676 RepID=A0A3B0XIK1_9ZZZZ
MHHPKLISVPLGVPMLIIMGRNQKEREWRALVDVQGCTNIVVAGRKGAKTCRDALISWLQDTKE